jgi:hypothetical protein
MFRFFRYTPVSREEAVLNPNSGDSRGSRSDRAETGQEIEMTQTRYADNSMSPAVIRARVLGIVSREDLNEETFEDFDDDAPSPLAVVAVRICVWALFLFGFLMLFHNQQEKFMFERSRQAGRLRSTQLIHIEVPWVGFSGFSEKHTCFTSQFIDSSPSAFGIGRFAVGSETFLWKRNGMSALSSDLIPTVEQIHQVLKIGESLIKLKKTENVGYSFVLNGQTFNFGIRHDIAFFRYFPSSSSFIVVSRPPGTDSVDCLTRFSSPSTCIESKAIVRAKAYFFDDPLNLLISVGIDTVSADQAGNDLKGVFVQTINPTHAEEDLSLSIPFINRFDEGMWAFNNSPLTDGFIVLLPIIGFPPAPIQHIVALREISDEIKKGSVVRMESEELRLFRKIDSIQFKPKPLPPGICSC